MVISPVALGRSEVSSQTERPIAPALANALRVPSGVSRKVSASVSRMTRRRLLVVLSARIGAIEERVGDKLGVECAHLADDTGDLLERPDIKRARDEGNEEDVGDGECRTLTGGVPPAGVDHDVLVLFRKAQGLGAQAAPVSLMQV